MCPPINQCFSTSLSDLVEDKMLICLSVSVCVLSTPVFLLALCRFHIGEEGNKKKKKKKSSTSVPKSLPIIVPTTFPSAPCVRPALGL